MNSSFCVWNLFRFFQPDPNVFLCFLFYKSILYRVLYYRPSKHWQCRKDLSPLLILDKQSRVQFLQYTRLFLTYIYRVNKRKEVAMSQKSLTQKLLIKPGHNVLLLNVPQEYADMLLPLPDGVTVSTTPGDPFDCIQPRRRGNLHPDSDRSRQAGWLALVRLSQENVENQNRHHPRCRLGYYL